MYVHGTVSVDDSCHEMSRRGRPDASTADAVNGMTGGAPVADRRRRGKGGVERASERQLELVGVSSRRTAATSEADGGRARARGPLGGRTRRQVNVSHYLPL